MDIRFRVCVAMIALPLFGVVACGENPPDKPVVAAHRQPTAGTRVVDYQPWRAGELAPGIHESASTTGSCWTTSDASARPDAYRCMDNNSSIFDPCFAAPTNGDQVACPYPSPSSVTLVNVDQLPAPNPTPSTGALWLLVLADGQQCAAVTGAVDMINGLRTTYACPPQGMLYGDPDHNNPQWMIYYQKGESQQLTSVPIATVYR